MRRRQRPSSHYAGRSPYSSSLRSAPSGRLRSFVSAKLPTLLMLSSFLLGWLLGRREVARGVGANVASLSEELLRSAGAAVLVFWGLAVRSECESPDGGNGDDDDNDNNNHNVAFCSIPQLLGKLMREKAVLERKMQSTKEYGAYYHQIFNDASTKPSPRFPTLIVNEKKRQRAVELRKEQTPLFLASSESAKKLSRRILVKHLRAVLREKGAASRSDGPPPTFAWITAGDAPAAAHGNLYSQSYTAVLEDAVRPSFRALGIDFRARNRGMGQYSSGPELALCMNEVFGDDVDVLLWDFASLQPGREPPRRSVLWGERAGRHPTRPVLFSFDSYGERFAGMAGAGGGGAVLMDADAMRGLRELTLPDSNNVAAHSHLPEGLRNYKCGASVEGGVRCDDGMRNFVCDLEKDLMDGMGGGGDGDDVVAENAKVCRANKFRTKTECIDARYQVSWHPGWKDHMLKGRLLGLFILNSLESALFDLDRLKSEHGDDPSTLLDILERAERRDKHEFERKKPDTKAWDEDQSVFEEMSSAMVLRGDSICHTALLPSRSRLEGITAETEGFDRGVNQFLMKSPEGVLPVAFDMNDRQVCQALEVDHKDFFLVREQDGWISTIVPNNKELEVYKRSTPVEGIIVLCLKICPLNKCPDAYIGIDELKRRTKLFITVDGEPVTNIQKLDSCHILAGDKGIHWGRKDQFELRFRINDPGTLHVLKISSIIVF